MRILCSLQQCFQSSSLPSAAHFSSLSRVRASTTTILKPGMHWPFFGVTIESLIVSSQLEWRGWAPVDRLQNASNFLWGSVGCKLGDSICLAHTISVAWHIMHFQGLIFQVTKIVHKIQDKKQTGIFHIIFSFYENVI